MSTFSWDRPKDRASSDLHGRIDAARYQAMHEEGRADAVDRLDAAEATGDTTERVKALQLIAERDQQTADHANAAKGLDVALATAGLSDHLLASVHLSRCVLRIRVGDADGARADAGLALRYASLAGSPTIASLAHTQSGVLHLAAGDDGLALDELNEAFSVGRENSLSGPKGHALAVVGCVYERQDRHDKAIEAWDRARLLHERAADGASVGRVYNNVGVRHFVEGRFTSAIPFFERALEILAADDDVVTVLAILNNNVRAYELHYFDRAAEFRTEMEDFAELLHDRNLPRFDDLGTLYKFAGPPPIDETYASSPVVGEPVMILPTYRLRHG